MTKKTSTKQNIIKLTLHNLGRVYESKGTTVEEAITNLKLPIAKGGGVLVLEKEDRKKERILNARVINNIFGESSSTTKNIAVKNIITLFNEFDK
jgi:hypothetical protein